MLMPHICRTSCKSTAIDQYHAKQLMQHANILRVYHGVYSTPSKADTCCRPKRPLALSAHKTLDDIADKIGIKDIGEAKEFLSLELRQDSGRLWIVLKVEQRVEHFTLSCDEPYIHTFRTLVPHSYDHLITSSTRVQPTLVIHPDSSSDMHTQQYVHSCATLPPNQYTVESQSAMITYFMKSRPIPTFCMHPRAAV
jgi:hypothetical protein